MHILLSAQDMARAARRSPGSAETRANARFPASGHRAIRLCNETLEVIAGLNGQSAAVWNNADAIDGLTP